LSPHIAWGDILLCLDRYCGKSLREGIYTFSSDDQSECPNLSCLHGWSAMAVECILVLGKRPSAADLGISVNVKRHTKPPPPVEMSEPAEGTGYDKFLHGGGSQ